MGGLAIRIHSEPLPRDEVLPGSRRRWTRSAYACARPIPDRFNSAKEMAEALAAALGGRCPRSVGVPKSSTARTATTR